MKKGSAGKPGRTHFRGVRRGRLCSSRGWKKKSACEGVLREYCDLQGVCYIYGLHPKYATTGLLWGCANEQPSLYIEERRPQHLIHRCSYSRVPERVERPRMARSQCGMWRLGFCDRKATNGISIGGETRLRKTYAVFPMLLGSQLILLFKDLLVHTLLFELIL